MCCFSFYGRIYSIISNDFCDSLRLVSISFFPQFRHCYQNLFLFEINLGLLVIEEVTIFTDEKGNRIMYFPGTYIIRKLISCLRGSSVYLFSLQKIGKHSMKKVNRTRKLFCNSAFPPPPYPLKFSCLTIWENQFT